MRITVSTAALASLISLALLGVGSAHASVPVDVRVATNDGGNLADVIQYVPNTTSIKTYNGPEVAKIRPWPKTGDGVTQPVFPAACQRSFPVSRA